MAAAPETANQAQSPGGQPGRPRAVASEGLINLCVGVLLARGEPLSTYDLVDILGDNPELSAQTPQGRHKQVERALRSPAAASHGVVAEAPGPDYRYKGRPPSKVWRLQQPRRAAA